MLQQEQSEVYRRLARGDEDLDWTDDLTRSELVERIAEKVSVCEETGCWEWTGATTRGYGQMKIEGRVRYVHRVAYRLAVGDIPEGKQINHECHNRCCVRAEDHAYLGTQSDNIQDAVERGTIQTNNAKLTESDVREIRERYASDDGVLMKDLADEFGVTEVCISKIIRRETWPHVD